MWWSILIGLALLYLALLVCSTEPDGMGDKC